MSQTSRILSYLRSGHSISAMSASYRFSCWRLAARIREIRNMGITVKTETIKTPTGHYAKYSIK